MSNPNIVLSWWQLTLMAVIPVALLAGWLIACFIAAREPRSHGAAAAGPVSDTGTGASVQDTSSQDTSGQDEAARPHRRLAA
jgi:hypothetical protein